MKIRSPVQYFGFWFFFVLSIYLFSFQVWLPWASVAVHGPSLAAASRSSSLAAASRSSSLAAVSRSSSLAAVHGLLILLLLSTSSRTQAQQLWFVGLVALCHAGSFWTKDQTRVPCIARQTLNHWTTREALACLLTTSLHQNGSIVTQGPA